MTELGHRLDCLQWGVRQVAIPFMCFFSVSPADREDHFWSPFSHHLSPPPFNRHSTPPGRGPSHLDSESSVESPTLVIALHQKC